MNSHSIQIASLASVKWYILKLVPTWKIAESENCWLKAHWTSCPCNRRRYSPPARLIMTLFLMILHISCLLNIVCFWPFHSKNKKGNLWLKNETLKACKSALVACVHTYSHVTNNIFHLDGWSNFLRFETPLERLLLPGTSIKLGKRQLAGTNDGTLLRRLATQRIIRRNNTVICIINKKSLKNHFLKKTTTKQKFSALEVRYFPDNSTGMIKQQSQLEKPWSNVIYLWAELHINAFKFLVYFCLGWRWHKRTNTSVSMQSSHSFWGRLCHCSKSDRFRQSVCRVYQTWRNRELCGSCDGLHYFCCLLPGDNLGKKGWFAGRKEGKFYSLYMYIKPEDTIGRSNLFPFALFYQMEVFLVTVFEKRNEEGKRS